MIILMNLFIDEKEEIIKNMFHQKNYLIYNYQD